MSVQYIFSIAEVFAVAHIYIHIYLYDHIRAHDWWSLLNILHDIHCMILNCAHQWISWLWGPTNWGPWLPLHCGVWNPSRCASRACIFSPDFISPKWDQKAGATVFWSCLEVLWWQVSHMHIIAYPVFNPGCKFDWIIKSVPRHWWTPSGCCCALLLWLLPTLALLLPLRVAMGVFLWREQYA